MRREMEETTICCSGCRDSQEEAPLRGRKLLRCMAEDAGERKGRTVEVYGAVWDKPPESPAPIWCPRRTEKKYP